MSDELIGSAIGAWTITEFVGAGKSAIVFKAKNGVVEGALKVFDPELVERFGKDVQTGRIKRELLLRGKEHPHLVKILDGGECARTRMLYVVMGYIEAPNLASIIQDVPRDRIWPIIGRLASAAQFLETNGLAYRDIKPDNVALGSDFQNPFLLDLGVVRPIGLGELTDEDEQKPFLGTLRYSPPELLIREEKDDLLGWRAVTFYQLGSVLHDLLMRRRLFAEYGEP